jgi:hypothetical protein
LWRNALHLLLAALLLASCKEEATVQPPPGSNNTSPVTEIVNGTYLYNCNGYCVDELSVASSNIVYMESGADKAQYAPRLKRSGISQQEWSDILNSIDLQAVAALDSVTLISTTTATPGNEWIEIRISETRKRIVFGYGDQLPDFQELLTKMRAIRNRLKT